MAKSDFDNDIDSDESFRFSPDERKLVTQPYDLSIQTLLDQWDDKTLSLPPIQREYVWDNGKASRLVESLILRIPIPVLYFAETEESKYEIIDGHQRVFSVVRYVQNEFALSGLWVLNEFQRKRFHQLPQNIARHIRTRIMRAIVIQADSHPSMKFEVFERLNQGSISLTSQELRNSTYRGPFNDFLREVVKDNTFRDLIGTAKPRKRMVDEELVLRFFALRERYIDYKAPLKRFLNSFMESQKNATPERLEDFRRDFEQTIGLVQDILGASAFRITEEDGTPRDRTINRALFEAQMLAFSWVDPNESIRADRIITELAKLYGKQEFLDAIQKATGNTANVDLRISSVLEALSDAGVAAVPPYSLRQAD